MSAPTGGPWTRHGHDIPGVTVAGAGRPAAIARCGGPALCRKCAVDAVQARGIDPVRIAPADSLATNAVAKLRSYAEEHDDDEVEALLREYDRRGAVLSGLSGLAAGGFTVEEVLAEFDRRGAEVSRLRARVDGLEAIERRADETSTWCGDNLMHRAVRYIRTGSTGDAWEVSS